MGRQTLTVKKLREMLDEYPDATKIVAVHQGEWTFGHVYGMSQQFLNTGAGGGRGPNDNVRKEETKYYNLMFNEECIVLDVDW